MRFLIDAQLPPALIRRLSAIGHEAEHVNRIGLGAAHDADIWSRAIQDSAVLLTKDDDFANRARDRSAPAQVVWIRLGNMNQ